MKPEIDFKTACDRIGIVQAAVLFRDRLPKNFWENLNVKQCFELMNNYPVNLWHSKGQGDDEEIVFRKKAYQSAQAKILSIVELSSSVDELDQVYVSDRDVQWWYEESTIGRHDFRALVLRKMTEIEPKTIQEWKKIRYHASCALREHQSSAHGYPSGVAKKALEELRARAATEIFDVALTAEDWHYLYTDEGTESHSSYSGKYLAGLTAQQHVVVSKRCAIFYGEIFGEENGEAMRILHDLPGDAMEHEILLDRLERSDYNFYPLVCGCVEPDSDRFKRTLARMKKENTFSSWIRYCEYFFNRRGNFFQTCLERAMALATTSDELESVLGRLDKKHPRRRELEKKLAAVEAERAKQKGRRRKKTPAGSEATLK